MTCGSQVRSKMPPVSQSVDEVGQPSNPRSTSINGVQLGRGLTTTAGSEGGPVSWAVQVFATAPSRIAGLWLVAASLGQPSVGIDDGTNQDRWR